MRYSEGWRCFPSNSLLASPRLAPCRGGFWRGIPESLNEGNRYLQAGVGDVDMLKNNVGKGGGNEDLVCSWISKGGVQLEGH